MLIKISCNLFRRGHIDFHEGLNVILGDDDAKNSIGKSSALMVIDFVMGGSSLLRDKSGVINSLGHHTYAFEFSFGGVGYLFSRSTDTSETVLARGISDGFEFEMTVEDYRKELKKLYALDSLQSSFRSTVGPFIRIWEKGELDPERPFSADSNEAAAVSIDRLIDIFERSDDVAEERSILAAHQERKKLISKSMNLEIIPKINKTQYKKNQKIIAENSRVLEELKQGVTGALSAYEALFDSELRELQLAKAEIFSKRNELSVKIERIERDIQGVTPRLSANISLVTEFFPDVNVDRLQKVEEFHSGIGKILKRELKGELTHYLEARSDIDRKISSLDERIRSRLENKGTPDDLFDRVFELKEASDKAASDNGFYERKVAIENEAFLSKNRLESVFSGVFFDIESSLNEKLRHFNNVIYGPERNASALRIKSGSSYTFISPKDSGTGKSYAGLVGFDLAMLSLTRLPFLVHDSVIYKNIEVPATRNIIRILGSIKKKQIFLAFDEAKKFGARAEGILRNNSVIKLSDVDLLFYRDWR